jgi:hypothetical protein
MQKTHMEIVPLPNGEADHSADAHAKPRHPVRQLLIPGSSYTFAFPSNLKDSGALLLRSQRRIAYVMHHF